jgi:hypothetical protein
MVFLAVVTCSLFVF